MTPERYTGYGRKGYWDDPVVRETKIRRLQALIDKEELPERCPECLRNQFVKHGKTAKGTPRYRCKNCGKTITPTGLVSGSQLTREQWMVYIECYVDRMSVRKAAERCGVSSTTAYRMRDRLIEMQEHDTSVRNTAPAYTCFRSRSIRAY